MFFCWMFLVCLFIHYGSTVIPKNQHDKISPKSQINNLSTRKYNNIHLKSKTSIRKVQENSGKVKEERKPITMIMPIAMDNRAKNYPTMAKKEKETKLKVGYDLLGPKVIREKSSESGISSQKEDKLLKLRNKREAEHFLSVTKRESKSKTNKSSTLPLEESILESKKTTKITSNSAFKYNLTAVQKILITKTQSNSDPVSKTLGHFSQKEIWFVSDEDLIGIIVKQNLHHVRIFKLFLIELQMELKSMSPHRYYH